MEANRANMVVMSSIPEFGVTSKDERGVLAADAPVPASLQVLQGALARASAKLGVRLDLSSKDLAQAFEAAMEQRGKPIEPSAKLDRPEL